MCKVPSVTVSCCLEFDKNIHMYIFTFNKSYAFRK